MHCSESKDMQAKFESAQSRYRRYSDKNHRDLVGLFSERAKTIQREEKANMTLLTQRMLDHRVTCLVCKQEAK
jgi:hypothetical protein